MESFVVRKRRKLDEEALQPVQRPNEEESTDYKLAILTSLHPDADYPALLECLLASNGSIEDASDLYLGQAFGGSERVAQKTRSSVLGYQGSLADFQITSEADTTRRVSPLTKKGKTLHLYSPKDIEEHTPCSIIHNFLPASDADALLAELLLEAPSFGRMKFKLFDKVVESPHTACFYVDSYNDAQKQKTEYIYNGSTIQDVRESLPEMLKVSTRVRKAVNREIQRRIKERYPNGQKLRYQSKDEWIPNCSFVNCYDGGTESVGYHTDQLTYVGPHAVIGSLSLGVAREFRVRRIVARDDVNESESLSPSKGKRIKDTERADNQGQIAIHLPHNSLLVMHAEMQEEWKHSIAPAPAIDPHPIAKNKRINITYRCYKEYLHPRYTPRCKCGIACVLRCVQRKKENRGRYMWNCHSHYTPGSNGCSYFKWADFDDDGKPPWALSDKCKEATNQSNEPPVAGSLLSA